MISRIWHGSTTPGNADKYEALLKEEIFVGIQNRHIRGFKNIQRPDRPPSSTPGRYGGRIRYDYVV
jgi:hypothetical protein